MRGARSAPAGTSVSARERWIDDERAPNRVVRPRRPRPRVLAGLILGSAVWGMMVDSPLIPMLRPTGNSTLFQSSTAAFFAVLGIFFGPLAGALGGLVRDGTGYALTLALHPRMVTEPGFWNWLASGAVDTFEDVMLGLVPGLVALWTRRVSVLVASAAVAAWVSLPFLVAGTLLAYGHAGQVWSALGTAPGDWNEPVDPGLTIYALLTGALVALALGVAGRTTRRWATLLLALAYAAPAVGLIALVGAHG